jgi:hypothetical protein
MLLCSGCTDDIADVTTTEPCGLSTDVVRIWSELLTVCKLLVAVPVGADVVCIWSELLTGWKLLVAVPVGADVVKIWSELLIGWKLLDAVPEICSDCDVCRFDVCSFCDE